MLPWPIYISHWLMLLLAGRRRNRLAEISQLNVMECFTARNRSAPDDVQIVNILGEHCSIVILSFLNISSFTTFETGRLSSHFEKFYPTYTVSLSQSVLSRVVDARESTAGKLSSSIKLIPPAFGGFSTYDPVPWRPVLRSGKLKQTHIHTEPVLFRSWATLGNKRRRRDQHARQSNLNPLILLDFSWLLRMSLSKAESAKEARRCPGRTCLSCPDVPRTNNGDQLSHLAVGGIEKFPSNSPGLAFLWPHKCVCGEFYGIIFSECTVTFPRALRFPPFPLEV